MRQWTDKAGMSCFYFEAFDESWKDAGNPDGSENHFGLITIDGKTKYALWDLVDAGAFEGLTRDGNPITKTFGGDQVAIDSGLLQVPLLSELGILKIETVNQRRQLGQPVTESRYIVAHDKLVPEDKPESGMTYPSAAIKLNIWEGSCNIQMSKEKVIEVTSGLNPDGWWGCGLEIEATESAGGENLTQFIKGHLHLDIQGDYGKSFNLGFQSGKFAAGNQVNNFVTFGPGQDYELTGDWKSHSIPVSSLTKGADFANITGALYLHGEKGGDGKSIRLRRVFFTRD